MMTIPLSDGMRSYLLDEHTLDYDQEIFIEGLVVAKDYTKNKGRINKGMQIIDDELHG